jgi:phage terminase Nu1 subunit (DNA packaging protein)
MAEGDKPKPFSALSSTDTAELLCCTKRQLLNYVEQGMPKHGNGRGAYYDWSEVFPWYVSYQIDLAKRRATVGMPEGADPNIVVNGETMAQAVLRKTIAEADLKELERAHERGEVVAVADVERNIAAVAKAVQTKLLAIPTKLASQLAAARSSKPRIKAILEGEARQVCSELVSVDWQPAEAKL